MSAEHDLDTVATFVAPLVVFECCLALLSAGYAGAYPLVLQCFSEPVGVVTAVTKQPVDLWQATQHCPRADVIADLSGGHKQVQRAAFAVADGMQLCIHTTLGPANQTTTPPFLTPMLVAVRWAFR